MWTNKTVENGETQILSKSMKNLDTARRRQCGVLSQDRHLFIWEWSEGNCDCEWWSVPRNTTREFFIPESRRRNPDFSDIFFQQNGTSNATRQLLLETFPNHVVSRFGDIAWPSRSPDLTSPDVFFFKCGDLKSTVYVNGPNTLPVLKDTIRDEISRISSETLQHKTENFFFPLLWMYTFHRKLSGISHFQEMKKCQCDQYFQTMFF